MMVDHAPPLGPALEQVGGQHRGDGEAAPDLREDVLGARHPPEVAAGGSAHVREREAQLAGVLEDRLPRRAHRLPADQERPARMHALHVLAVRPHLVHPGEVERLECLVEAGVGLLDLGQVAHRGPVVAAGRRTTSVSPSRASGNGVSRSPTHGPAVHRPLIGSKTAPWVEQISARPSSLKNSLGQRSSGVPTCGQRLTYARRGPSWFTTKPLTTRPARSRRKVGLGRGGTSAGAQRHSSKPAMTRMVSSMGMLAIDARDVEKTFRSGWLRRRETRALRGVSLTVERGAIVGVLGPNGAGKTTLLSILATLLVPDRGTVTVLGHDVVREASLLRRRLNMASGRPSFLWSLRVGEIVAFYGRLYGLSGRALRAGVDALIELTELGPYRRVPYSDLSTGLKQRVALAKSLVNEPELLFLDEPTLGLDPDVAARVRAHIARLRR